MPKLTQYGHDAKAQKAATLRRQLDILLAKSLAYRRSNKPGKATEFAERLVAAMVRAKLLSRAGVGDYQDELRRSLKDGQ